MIYDKIIIGAGLYGLYSALFCARKGQKILVLEYDEKPFERATYINQARVHMGYHYPRSLATAIKSAHYFERFNEDFHFCILDEFEQIYATSSSFSWTNEAQFQKFCKDAGIYCRKVPVDEYFNNGMCDGAFLTKEYTYDAQILKEYFLSEIAKYSNVELRFNVRINKIRYRENWYDIEFLNCSDIVSSDYILNAAYASVNQVLNKVDNISPKELFNIKYELCEIILCNVSGGLLGNVGLTVMDGPFFSIMPFGKTGLHSLTSVTFTPHMTCFEKLPIFSCQKLDGKCSSKQLNNCNFCPEKPSSSWPYMSMLAHKYVRDEYKFTYNRSLFSMKPILKTSEIDDSRPTVIKKLSNNPTFISVLSGKINTVYDLDEVLI